MHEPSNAAPPKWLAFYDLAKACGAFRAPPQADPVQSEPCGAFAPMRTISAPNSPAIRLEAIARL